MDDLKDHLQLSEDLTDLLSRVCEAIADYGEWTDWRGIGFDHSLFLSKRPNRRVDRMKACASPFLD